MQTIINALPKDLASLFTLALVAAFAVAVVIVGKRSGKKEPKVKDPE